MRLALELGLPTDDEVNARAALGLSLLRPLGSIPDSDIEKALSTSEAASEGISELGKALSIDAQGGYGFFQDVFQRGAWLASFEPVCTMQARAICKREGIDAAIKYLENKLRLFDYLPGTHMALLHFELGHLYHEKNQRDAARTSWRRSIEAELLNPEEPRYELETGAFLIF